MTLVNCQNFRFLLVILILCHNRWIQFVETLYVCNCTLITVDQNLLELIRIQWILRESTIIFRVLQLKTVYVIWHYRLKNSKVKDIDFTISQCIGFLVFSDFEMYLNVMWIYYFTFLPNFRFLSQNIEKNCLIAWLIQIQ